MQFNTIEAIYCFQFLPTQPKELQKAVEETTF